MKTYDKLKYEFLGNNNLISTADEINLCKSVVKLRLDILMMPIR